MQIVSWVKYCSKVEDKYHTEMDTDCIFLLGFPDSTLMCKKISRKNIWEI